jgi:hypothetical protein
MNVRSGRLTRLAALLGRAREMWAAVRARPGTRQALFGQFEPALYALFASVCTLAVATWFAGSMRQQVAMLLASLGDDPTAAALRALGAWSAPLDDVFIHFDVARATARGHPFEWSEGNGFSSGGTSLLYPWVLALGYVVGFRHLWLGLWAMAVASVSVFGLLLAVRRVFSRLPRPAAYLAPPLLLAVGALDWNLWSGMEVALYLGLWGGALVAWDDLTRPESVKPGFGGALRLGLWGALLVATRPEGVTSVAVLSITAAVLRFGRGEWRKACVVLAAATLPGLCVVVGQAAVNRWLTGDSSSAGAVAKLELFDPFLAPGAVFDAWKFHVKYQIRRITEHHLGDQPSLGWLWWGLALVPLGVRATRRYAWLLWSSAASWVLLVGLNGQVRWQNERYAMPALAWLLLLAALGVGVMLSLPSVRSRASLGVRVSGAVVAMATLGLLLWHQRPRFRDQVWFFGRASRNILEQHARAGLILRQGLGFPPRRGPDVLVADAVHIQVRSTPEEESHRPPRRVLVGDAGAIVYAADLPALDLIGLGGFRGLPFARAKRLGIGAALEILEHVAPTDRPDVLAIYPSWWDALPLWFGERVAEVPVRGNVICGGASKVIYRSDWSPLSRSAHPRGLAAHEAVADAVDFGDLLSEERHRYRPSAARSGRVEMKLLADPDDASVDLWDAGRVLAPGESVSVALGGLTPGLPTSVLVRLAPDRSTRLRLFTENQPLGELACEPGDNWQHVRVPVPARLVNGKLDLRLAVEVGATVIYHLWAVQTR